MQFFNKFLLPTFQVDAFLKSKLTFGEIYEKSVQCAISLKKIGVKKNDVVLIMSENLNNYIVAVSAVWYLGAIVNPINPAYTTREYKLRNVFCPSYAFKIIFSAGEALHIINLTKPKIVFCSEQALQTINSIRDEANFSDIIIFGNTNDASLKNFDEFLKNGKNDMDNFYPDDSKETEDVCMIILSSGTSGLPKGVMLSNKNLTYALTYLT